MDAAREAGCEGGGRGLGGTADGAHLGRKKQLWIKAFLRVGTDVVLDVMPRVRLVERPQVGAVLALLLCGISSR